MNRISFSGARDGTQPLRVLPAWPPKAKAFGTGLRTKKLKTIINRFLHAFCPLRVQAPSCFVKTKRKDTNYRWYLFFFGSRDGTWTRMVSHTHLKRARLPIPPLSHISRICDKSYYSRDVLQCQQFFSIFSKNYLNSSATYWQTVLFLLLLAYRQWRRVSRNRQVSQERRGLGLKAPLHNPVLNFSVGAFYERW